MDKNLLLIQAQKAKIASSELGITSTKKKNKALNILADNLTRHSPEILKENNKDLSINKDLGESFLDRLELNNARIQDLINQVHKVAELPDPIGKIIETNTRNDGLKISRVKVALGVIGVIYESIITSKMLVIPFKQDA